MAFVSRGGNLLGRKHASLGSSSSSSLLFQAFRNMSSAKLFVGGLPYEIDEIGLRIAFQKYGEVTEARVIPDPGSGRSKGFGFVSYASTDAANAALEAMDGKELHGRRIRVRIAQEKTCPA